MLVSREKTAYEHKGCRVGAGCGEWTHWLVRAYSISSSYTNYTIVYTIVYISVIYVAKSTSKEELTFSYPLVASP
jgi:hypothetical protein